MVHLAPPPSAPTTRLAALVMVPLVLLLLSLVCAPVVTAQSVTGEQFCEGHGWDEATCRTHRDCCEWEKADSACYSAVGDAVCGVPKPSFGDSEEPKL